jgi:regulator of chromosome condensation
MFPRRCKVCFTLNDPGAIQCPSCETYKPGAVPPRSSAPAPAPAGNAFGGDPFASSTTGNAFGGDPFASSTTGNAFGGDPFASSTTGNAFGGDPFASSTAPPVNPFDGSAVQASVKSNPFGESKSVMSDRKNPAAFLEQHGALPPITGEEDSAPVTGDLDKLMWHCPVSALDGFPRGESWAWGSAECDQMELEEDDAEEGVVAHPVLVKPLVKEAVVQLAAGGLHTLALTSSGRVFSWGCNDDCVLGRTGTEAVPAPVSKFDGTTLQARFVACGDSHSAAVDQNGRVWVWGTYKGKEGLMGFSRDMKRAAEPVEMKECRKYGKVAHLSCGADHTVVVTEGGKLLTWGNGEQGQLGHPVSEVRMRGDRQKSVTLRVVPVTVRAHEPTGVGERRRKVVARIANAFAGGYSLWVVTTGGTVLACGLNCYGQLGLGDTEDRDVLTEVPALSGKGVVQIVSGQHHALALTASGELYAIGRGDGGQLGLTPTDAGLPPCDTATFLPRRVVLGGLKEKTVVQVSANSNLSSAVCSDGSAYVWGFGESGQLGSDEFEDSMHPQRVTGSGMAKKRVIQLVCGGQHTACLVSSEGAPARPAVAVTGGATVSAAAEAVEASAAKRVKTQ